MGVQKHIDDDVLGEMHAFALMVLSLQSSQIEEWLKAVSCKMFDGRTLVLLRDQHRLSSMHFSDSHAPLLHAEMCFDVLVLLS